MLKMNSFVFPISASIESDDGRLENVTFCSSLMKTYFQYTKARMYYILHANVQILTIHTYVIHNDSTQLIYSVGEKNIKEWEFNGTTTHLLDGYISANQRFFLHY